ncbi:unnamed protein product [Amoebophrya sp. A120]|nr:unnamed protein product [Amoebophrya sp. A120]|eukprot:GSA120T00013574001.1
MWARRSEPDHSRAHWQGARKLAAITARHLAVLQLGEVFVLHNQHDAPHHFCAATKTTTSGAALAAEDKNDAVEDNDGATSTSTTSFLEGQEAGKKAAVIIDDPEDDEEDFSSDDHDAEVAAFVAWHFRSGGGVTNQIHQAGRAGNFGGSTKKHLQGKKKQDKIDVSLGGENDQIGSPRAAAADVGREGGAFLLPDEEAGVENRMGEFLEQQATAGLPTSTMVTTFALPHYGMPNSQPRVAAATATVAPARMVQVDQYHNRPLVAVHPSAPFPVFPGSVVAGGVAPMSSSTTAPGGPPVATPAPGQVQVQRAQPAPPAKQTPAERFAVLPQAEIVQLVKSVGNGGATYKIADGNDDADPAAQKRSAVFFFTREDGKTEKRPYRKGTTNLRPGADYTLLADGHLAFFLDSTNENNHVIKPFSVSSETPDGGVQLGGAELELKVRVEGTTDAKQKLYNCFPLDSALPMAVSDTQSTAPAREEDEAGGTAAAPEDPKQHELEYTVQRLVHDEKAKDQDACLRHCTFDKNCKGWAWKAKQGECLRWGHGTIFSLTPHAKAATIHCDVITGEEKQGGEEEDDSASEVSSSASTVASTSDLAVDTPAHLLCGRHGWSHCACMVGSGKDEERWKKNPAYSYGNGNQCGYRKKIGSECGDDQQAGICKFECHSTASVSLFGGAVSWAAHDLCHCVGAETDPNTHKTGRRGFGEVIKGGRVCGGAGEARVGGKNVGTICADGAGKCRVKPLKESMDRFCVNSVNALAFAGNGYFMYKGAKLVYSHFFGTPTTPEEQEKAQGLVKTLHDAAAGGTPQINPMQLAMLDSDTLKQVAIADLTQSKPWTHFVGLRSLGHIKESVYVPFRGLLENNNSVSPVFVQMLNMAVQGALTYVSITVMGSVPVLAIPLAIIEATEFYCDSERMQEHLEKQHSEWRTGFCETFHTVQNKYPHATKTFRGVLKLLNGILTGTNLGDAVKQLYEFGKEVVNNWNLVQQVLGDEKAKQVAEATARALAKKTSVYIAFKKVGKKLSHLWNDKIVKPLAAAMAHKLELGQCLGRTKMHFDDKTGELVPDEDKTVPAEEKEHGRLHRFFHKVKTLITREKAAEEKCLEGAAQKAAQEPETAAQEPTLEDYCEENSRNPPYSSARC